MTIAIGVLARNGVVLAADSEIATPGDITGVDTKLVAVVQEIGGRPVGSFAIAGAGSFGYFQALRFKVANLVAGSLGPDEKSDSRVEKRLEKFMDEFHKKHVVPYSRFPDPPRIEVLVGTWVNGKGTLWASEMGTIRPAPFGYDAIGAGGTYALNLLHGYFKAEPVLTVDSVCLLASYVILHTKFTVANCGKDTHMILLSGGEPVHLSRELLLECESIFDRCYPKFQSQALSFVLGVDDRLDPTWLRESRKRLNGVRQSIRSSISSMVHT